jgi:putative tricarboxylic transport membrane protein
VIGLAARAKKETSTGAFMGTYIAAGKMRAIGVTSQKRLPGVPVPTMKEQGYDVVIGNWRGVYGAPGISAEQRDALSRMIVEATRTKAWAEAMQANKWTPALMTGKDFDEFVDYEFSALRAIIYLAGMA